MEGREAAKHSLRYILGKFPTEEEIDFFMSGNGLYAYLKRHEKQID